MAFGNPEARTFCPTGVPLLSEVGSFYGRPGNRKLQTNMRMMSKFLLVSLAAGLLLLFSPTEVGAGAQTPPEPSGKEERRLSVTFEGRRMSANIDGVPFKLVLDQIKEKRGV